jgi:serine/threonine protein kinase
MGWSVTRCLRALQPSWHLNCAHVRIIRSDLSFSVYRPHPTYPPCCATLAAYTHDEVSKFGRDVWALGVCLYCFVTGRLPFIADNVMEMYDKIRNDEYVSPKPCAPTFCPAPRTAPDRSFVHTTRPSFADIDDEGLVSLLRGTLDKDPTQRLTLDQILVRAIRLRPRVSVKMHVFADVQSMFVGSPVGTGTIQLSTDVGR